MPDPFGFRPDIRAQTGTDPLIAHLARRQHGVVTRSQLLARGVQSPRSRLPDRASAPACCPARRVRRRSRPRVSTRHLDGGVPNRRRSDQPPHRRGGLGDPLLAAPGGDGASIAPASRHPDLSPTPRAGRGDHPERDPDHGRGADASRRCDDPSAATARTRHQRGRDSPPNECRLVGRPGEAVPPPSRNGCTQGNPQRALRGYEKRARGE